MKELSRKFPKGDQLYESITPIAKTVKALVQAVIGVVAVIVLLVQLCTHLANGALDLGDIALAIIGTALAFSAAVELAYTFFTDGPDEALDPLILGLASFALIEISRKKVHLAQTAIPVLLIVLAIAVLFATRRFLAQLGSENAPQKSMTQDGGVKRADSPGVPSPRPEVPASDSSVKDRQAP
jgi:type IV secretory pathway VirB2 component (pilin)